jgi:putative acetyltransferase
MGMNRISIRHERAEDAAGITEILLAAFRDHPYSNQTEHLLVAALRESGGLTLSLVAEVPVVGGGDGNILAGQIAFSPVRIDGRDCHWYGVGPLAVRPGLQKRGIGRALVRHGLREIKTMGGKGCVLVGDPRYYERFEFASHPGLVYDDVPAEYFLARSLGGTYPSGAVAFHEAFAVCTG